MGIFSISSFLPSFCSDLIDVSEKIIEQLHPSGAVSWRFFENSESGELFAVDVQGKDRHGNTALQYAAADNLAVIAKALINANVDPDARNEFSNTALHFAATFNSLETGRMLIESGADVRSENHYGETPRDIARRYGHAEFADTCEKKCKLKIKN